MILKKDIFAEHKIGSVLIKHIYSVHSLVHIVSGDCALSSVGRLILYVGRLPERHPVRQDTDVYIIR